MKNSRVQTITVGSEWTPGARQRNIFNVPPLRVNHSPRNAGSEGSRWSFAAENRWKKERVTTNNFTKDVAWAQGA